MLAGAGALALSVAVFSYVAKLREPGNDTVVERSVEWLRDNHLGPIVDWFEARANDLHPPAVGGEPPPITMPTAPTPTSIPAVGTGVQATPAHLPAPAPVHSPASSSVPGEGTWSALGPQIDGAQPMYVTEVRPDAVHTSYLTAIVWMDPKLLRFEQHPGAEVPGGQHATPSSVPSSEQGALLAAFNGGFRMQDARGGYFEDGVASGTMVNGAATLAIASDGTATVGMWGRDLTSVAGLSSARQNLALIVDGGAPAPTLDDNPGDAWGATVGNKAFVWRSGVGVTADGALVYAAGPALSARTLAESLARAGAIRAMELDINHDWVTFNTYVSAGGKVTGTKLLEDMARPSDRYLTTDSRDFVAVLKRR